MDELTLLRKVRDDVAPPSNAMLMAGRAQLMERVTAELVSVEPMPARRPADRRRTLRRLGIASGLTAVAAGLAVTLVLTDLVGLAGWRGGADSAAAAALQQAAESAAYSHAIPQAGQYVLIAESGFVTGVSNSCDECVGEPVLTKDTVDSRLYIPANQGDDWVWERLQPSGNTDLLRAPGGTFYSHPSVYNAVFYNELPSDPYRLLNRIYRTIPYGTADFDQYAFQQIRDMLLSGIAPAEVSTTLLKAMAMIPGVTVSDEHAQIGGRAGVAIGRGLDVRDDLIIDSATGTVLGERSTQLAEGSAIPAGTLYLSVAISTSIVDTAPQGGDPDGYLTGHEG